MGKKATKAEVQRRTEEVVRMLVGCKRKSEIHAYARDEWGVCRQTADEYVARAREVLRDDYSQERADFLTSKLGVLEQIVISAMESNQHSNAIGAVRLMAELTGGFPEKHK